MLYLWCKKLNVKTTTHLVVKILFFLFFFYLTPIPLQAEDNAEVKMSIAPLDQNATPLDDQALIDLAKEAHNTLEGGGDDHGDANTSLLKKMLNGAEWKEKFNFKNIILNALRWYQLKSDNPQIKTHAANILTMLLTSHTIETVGGAFMASAGAGSHNVVLNVLGPVIGFTIMVPGLDPLCIALFVSYVKFPRLMGKAVYYPRIVLLESTQFLFRSLGINHLLNLLFPKEDALTRLERSLAKREGHSEIIKMNEEIHIKIGSDKNQEAISLKGKLESGKILWESVYFSRDLENDAERKIILQKIKGLNWVLRESLAQSLERSFDAATLRSLPYVQDFTSDELGTSIQFKGSSLASTTGHRLHSKAFNLLSCFQKLQKS